MRSRRAVTIVGAAVLAAGAASVALAPGRPPTGHAPSVRLEARSEASVGGSRPPGPSAEDESGIAALAQGPRSLAAAQSTGRPPARTPPAGPRSAGLRPPGEPPREPRDGGAASRVVAPSRIGAREDGRSSGATAPGGTAQPAEPEPSQPAILPPPAIALPPPVSAPAPPAPVLTPPVPVDLSPPRHPLPYRMVVDAPGLAAAARLEAVEARVRLRVTVQADGTVGRVEVAMPSGRPELDAAALEAARQWRFLPARRNDEPIESVALIWVAFVVGP